MHVRTWKHTGLVGVGVYGQREAREELDNRGARREHVRQRQGIISRAAAHFDHHGHHVEEDKCHGLCARGARTQAPQIRE